MPVCPRCSGRVLVGLELCPACLFGAVLPERVGSVRLLEEIGRGGMGTVYRGYDDAVGREVAVKLLTSPEGTSTKRMEREGRLLASLSHPNLVQVYAAGAGDCQHYIIMELVEGAALSTLLPLSVDRAVDVARQICAALAHAHARGIVHRDIKPSNVLVEADGRVKVSDFGLAREVEPTELNVTQSRVVVCTPGYAAPEVWAGAKPAAQMDVYSVGVLLLDMISERNRAAQLHPGLARVVRQATAVRPVDRYADAQQLGRALAKLREHGRRRRQFAALAPALAGLAAGLAVLLGAVTLEQAAPSVDAEAHRFRQGLDGYQGARDHWFSSRAGEAHNPESPYLRTGRHESGEFQAVLGFSGLFGEGQGQLVPGTAIARASLTLQLPIELQYSEGEALAVHQLLVDWQDGDGYGADPWKLGATPLVDLDDVEAQMIPADDSARYATDGVMPRGTTIELDVTSIVASWSAGAVNCGFLLRSVGGAGGDTPFIASSRWYDPKLRPTLTIATF